MILRPFKPHGDPSLLKWVEDVARALTAQIGGLSWADNIGPILKFRYLAANAPISVRTTVIAPPSGVVLLRATNLTDRKYESGSRVRWTLAKEHLVIHAIDVVDTDDEYEVTLGLLMG